MPTGWRTRRPRLLVLLQFLFLRAAQQKVTAAWTRSAQLTGRGWDVTVAATGDADYNWLGEFARHTPDVFVLQHFLNTEGKPGDYPRFLRYLANSRQFDGPAEQHQAWLRSAPAREAGCRKAAFVDIRHNANWPQMSRKPSRSSTGGSSRLQSSATKSTTLSTTPPAEVLYTNVDTDLWRPASPRQARGGSPVAWRGRRHPDHPVHSPAGGHQAARVFARTVLALHRRGLRFVAVAVGDGPLLPWLRTFAVENGR